MNPRSEFVKAIVQVLRLEANIYTMGAVEEIIERVDQEDYSMFIAFLGERDSDYEKPIQSIAKGVNEFYDMKINPIRIAVKNKAENIYNFISGYISFNSKDRLRSEVISETESDPTRMFLVGIATNGTEPVRLSRESYDLVIDIGGIDIFLGANGLDKLRIKLMGEKLKPSIIEKIQNGAVKKASEDFQIESSKVKALLLRNTPSIYAGDHA